MLVTRLGNGAVSGSFKFLPLTAHYPFAFYKDSGTMIMRNTARGVITMPTIRYHAVMLDETRCEFGADVEAKSRDEAYDLLREYYPESKCVQLESPADTRAREQDLYEHISRGGDWDDDGRPIYHYDYEDDYEEEDE